MEVTTLLATSTLPSGTKSDPVPPSAAPKTHRFWAALLFALLTPLLTSGYAPTVLEQVLERGHLTLITRSGATTYYSDAAGAPAGFEYDLVAAFAAWLGVELRVHESNRFSELLPDLNNGLGDLVAANLALTPQRAQQVAFSTPYNSTRAIVVYRRGEVRPRDAGDLVDGRLAVIAASSYSEKLRQLQQQGAALKWTELGDVGIEDLLNAISENELDYTVIDENLFQLNAPFFPLVRRAFVLGEETPLAWAFPRQADPSLRQAAAAFIQASQEDQTIAQLQQRYTDNLDEYNKVETYTYLKQVRQRLPRLRPLFEAAAAELDGNLADWKLLAAIGYQESHWDPNAISPTGVRGVMMLTQRTAKQMGITNRRDPHQSISGGARYLQSIYQRLPASIEGNDRIWLALAAYNVGFGHLEDARVLTQRGGGNPNHWEDVSRFLPLLNRKAHYSQTKFGYARGNTAVKYVDRIRTYYEILRWMDLREHPLLAMEYDASQPVF